MLQHHITPLLAASWRGQCMSIFLIPMALIESMYPSKRVNWLEVKPGLPYPIIVHTVFSGIAWSGNLLFWILGLRYVSSFMASVIFSTHPLMLCLFLKLSGSPVSMVEMIGVMIAFMGLLVSCLPDLLLSDAHTDTVPDTVSDTDNTVPDTHSMITTGQMVIGITFCFASAACEVLVLFNRIATKKHVPLMQYTAATSLVVMIISTIASLILEDSLLICPHGCVEVCIWGWTSGHWILIILLFGFVVGVVFIAGFNYALQHIPPLVFSSLSLADPALTAGFSWVFGIEGSWLGGIIVMSGVGVISYGEHRRTSSSSSSSHTTTGVEVELISVLSSNIDDDNRSNDNYSSLPLRNDNNNEDYNQEEGEKVR